MAAYLKIQKTNMSCKGYLGSVGKTYVARNGTFLPALKGNNSNKAYKFRIKFGNAQMVYCLYYITLLFITYLFWYGTLNKTMIIFQR
jgi:hypothetical protein